jgi:hypothetical protein
MMFFNLSMEEKRDENFKQVYHRIDLSLQNYHIDLFVFPTIYSLLRTNGRE